MNEHIQAKMRPQIDAHVIPCRMLIPDPCKCLDRQLHKNMVSSRLEMQLKINHCSMDNFYTNLIETYKSANTAYITMNLKIAGFNTHRYTESYPTMRRVIEKDYVFLLSDHSAFFTIAPNSPI